MDLSLSIIDQQVKKLAADLGEALQGDEGKRRSQAFVVLCARTLLDLTTEEALDCLVDGGQDAGIDALHLGEVANNEFLVTLFQGKYKARTDGAAAFPANAISRIEGTIRALFDPAKELSLHPRLLARVEEARSLVVDGYLPVVRVVLCNNGQRWAADGQAMIDAAAFPADQVTWEHLSTEILVSLQRVQKPVDETLQLEGHAAIEQFNFRRVLVGKAPVAQIKALFDRHGERLLERNIRRYLGVGGNRVNRAMAETLRTPTRRGDFYFFNNGVTFVCSKFRHNALQGQSYQLRIDDLQVINGGQTCITIQRTLSALPDDDFSQTFVLVRLYELDERTPELVQQITYATNSQSPVDLRDLRANDPIQEKLEIGLRQLGFEYRRKRDEGGGGPEVIRSSQAAEAVLAVWRRKPHVARFQREHLFARSYDEIFTPDLLPAQVAAAVTILRAAEELRRTTARSEPRFLPHAAHFLAMLAGEQLLAALGVPLTGLTHDNWAQAAQVLRERLDGFFLRAILQVQVLLVLLPIDEETVSLQRLSATFRRGDLLRVLDELERRAISAVEPLEARDQQHVVASERAEELLKEIHERSAAGDLEESQRLVDEAIVLLGTAREVRLDLDEVRKTFLIRALFPAVKQKS